MKIAFSIFFLSIALATKAQYYYKDIHSNKDVAANLALYKKNNIREINIKSIEADGKESPGFFCNKKISKDYRKTELFTRADFASASLMTTVFNKDGQILSNTDSSKLSVSQSIFTYGNDGKLLKISSRLSSSDDDFVTDHNEEHIYSYDSAGHFESMKQVIEGKDTTLYLFATDDNGNVITEYDTKRDSYYYYYYDDKNRLTDVVISNSVQPKPTPQYMFQYNRNKLVQMTTVDEGRTDYTIWKYAYDGDLVTTERCLANGKKLLGSVQYDYK